MLVNLSGTHVKHTRQSPFRFLEFLYVRNILNNGKSCSSWMGIADVEIPTERPSLRLSRSGYLDPTSQAPLEEILLFQSFILKSLRQLLAIFTANSSNPLLSQAFVILQMLCLSAIHLAHCHQDPTCPSAWLKSSLHLYYAHDRSLPEGG